MNRLKNIKKITKLIEIKTSELERLNDMMIKSGVLDYSKDRIQSTPNNDSIIDTIQKVIDLQNSICESINELIELKHECVTRIEQLDDPSMIELAYKRYFEFKTFAQCADEMKYTERWVQELDRRLMNTSW